MICEIGRSTPKKLITPFGEKAFDVVGAEIIAYAMSLPSRPLTTYLRLTCLAGQLIGCGSSDAPNTHLRGYAINRYGRLAIRPTFRPVNAMSLSPRPHSLPHRRKGGTDRSLPSAPSLSRTRERLGCRRDDDRPAARRRAFPPAFRSVRAGHGPAC